MEMIPLGPESETDQISSQGNILEIVRMDFLEERRRRYVVAQEELGFAVTGRIQEGADTQIGLSVKRDVSHSDTYVTFVCVKGGIHCMIVQIPVHEISCPEIALGESPETDRQKRYRDCECFFHKNDDIEG